MARTANPNRISKVDITDDTLTGRVGMSLFGRYLLSVGILSLLGDSFGRIRKNAKGLAATFKEDVLSEVIPVTSYATTVRRKIVDIAAKTIKTGGSIILKVTRHVMETFAFTELWALSNTAVPIHQS